MALPKYEISVEADDIVSPQLEAISRAMAQNSHTADALRYASGGLLRPPTSNPCNEIILRDGVECWPPEPKVTRIEGGSIVGNTISTGKIQVIYKNNYERDFNENIWTIELPGISKDRIEVFQVEHYVYVQIDKDKTKRLTKVLEANETVKSTKLDLGILTIVIDRPNKRQDIEIG